MSSILSSTPMNSIPNDSDDKSTAFFLTLLVVLTNRALWRLFSCQNLPDPLLAQVKILADLCV